MRWQTLDPPSGAVGRLAGRAGTPYCAVLGGGLAGAPRALLARCSSHVSGLNAVKNVDSAT